MVTFQLEKGKHIINYNDIIHLPPPWVCEEKQQQERRAWRWGLWSGRGPQREDSSITSWPNAQEAPPSDCQNTLQHSSSCLSVAPPPAAPSGDIMNELSVRTCSSGTWPICRRWMLSRRMAGSTARLHAHPPTGCQKSSKVQQEHTRLVSAV